MSSIRGFLVTSKGLTSLEGSVWKLYSFPALLTLGSKVFTYPDVFTCNNTFGEGVASFFRILRRE